MTESGFEPRAAGATATIASSSPLGCWRLLADAVKHLP
jgi:hypothetical protein